MKWLILLIFLIGCGPRCIRGHYEKAWWPDYYTYDPITIGDITVYMMNYHQGYWYDRFICDQYEVEKEK